ANNLPEGSQWKSWMIIIAPSASVAVSVCYAWIKISLERYLKKRELKSKFSQARNTLLEALDNPRTSEEHRAQLRKELEQLELLLVQSDLERIRLLTGKEP